MRKPSHFKPAAITYAFKSLRAGEYRAATRHELFLLMKEQASRASTNEERQHFAQQVGYALSTTSIHSRQGELLYMLAGFTRDGGTRWTCTNDELEADRAACAAKAGLLPRR